MLCAMARVEYYRDPHGPVATTVSAAVFAFVRDESGALLMVRRADSGNWELPGGHVDPGESAIGAAEREVAEESGLTVKVLGVAGVYSDPAHVLVYPASGETRQQFAVYFHAAVLDGVPRADGVETAAVAWIPEDRLVDLPVHPVVRSRLQQILHDPASAHIG